MHWHIDPCMRYMRMHVFVCIQIQKCACFNLSNTSKSSVGGCAGSAYTSAALSVRSGVAAIMKVPPYVWCMQHVRSQSWARGWQTSCSQHILFTYILSAHIHRVTLAALSHAHTYVHSRADALLCLAPCMSLHVSWCMPLHPQADLVSPRPTRQSVPWSALNSSAPLVLHAAGAGEVRHS